MQSKTQKQLDIYQFMRNSHNICSNCDYCVNNQFYNNSVTCEKTMCKLHLKIQELENEIRKLKEDNRRLLAGYIRERKERKMLKKKKEDRRDKVNA